MQGHHQRPLWRATVALVVTWLVCVGGYKLAGKSKVTAATMEQDVRHVAWAKLSPEERAKALHALMDKFRKMSAEDQHRWHPEHAWFAQLTGDEKAWFMDAYVPLAMKQELAFFEKMPKAKRNQMLDDAMRDVRNQAKDLAGGPDGASQADVLSPELDAKVRTMGLISVFSDSSPQTRAEMAPLLMEIQRQFDSGQMRIPAP